ncbi:hypothetical protein Catovirus_1_142 [Catovirus CTV1]|uniref:Uncharacterized protein n=1 Tax=Catovirus CTV1 TaxID=1977631 RepID=A0A1V0S8Q8_9VIRU|nr:hypothetical protein Catovirus_1_142 [Catovirus CTV1]
MLTQANTWYAKYGFMPYNYTKDIIDYDTLVRYKVNKILVNKIKLGCTNIDNIIENTITANNLENQLSVDKFKKIYAKYKEFPILKFFKDFLARKQYEIFGMCYREIMEDVGLYNLHGVTYILYI